jgi:hypothetical protein
MASSGDSMEFLVIATDRFTGRPFPRFIVPATDAVSARRRCERPNLDIQSIERYEAEDGVAKPRVCPLGPPDAEAEGEWTEFVVFAQEKDTGKPWPLFIVPAQDAETARRISERRYLVINAVERLDDEPGVDKPQVYPWGPPVSDQKFEREYHNRAPERESRSEQGRGNAVGSMVVAGCIVLLLQLVYFVVKALLR